MRSGKRLAVGLGFAMLTLFGSLSAAHAQYYQAPPPYYPPPPPRGVYRSGLLLGLGLGGGAITAEDCSNCGGGALGLAFNVGGMIDSRMALVFDLWGLFRSLGDGVTLSQSIYTGSLQYWVAPQVWLKGGVGGGTVDLSDDYSGASFSRQSAFAMSGAAGLELIQSYNFALDLQFRLAHVFYSDGGANNIALLVGVNWY